MELRERIEKFVNEHEPHHPYSGEPASVQSIPFHSEQMVVAATEIASKMITNCKEFSTTHAAELAAGFTTFDFRKRSMHVTADPYLDMVFSTWDTVDADRTQYELLNDLHSIALHYVFWLGHTALPISEHWTQQGLSLLEEWNSLFSHDCNTFSFIVSCLNTD